MKDRIRKAAVFTAFVAVVAAVVAVLAAASGITLAGSVADAASLMEG